MFYLFKDFVLDTDRRELRRRTEPVPLAPQVFDLLEYFIRNRERVVSRDDLLAAVWQGRIVSESAMTTRINAVRTAIGDSGEKQELIKTLPRKGFRFVALVREQSQSLGTKAVSETATEPPSGARALGTSASMAPRLTPAIPDRPSIAVLPFDNLSGDSEQEYFADGVVEEIITALSRFSALFVIARNSSFTFKGRAVDVRDVGQELGVRYVLEGSVRRGGEQVRIAGQLIDATTGAHVWADRFDGTLGNIFDLQDHITMSVVSAVLPKLEQAEIERAWRKPTESLTSYDFYLRGRASFHEWTEQAFDRALQYFYSAIEADPGFSSAYGMAAMCYAQRHMNGLTSDRQREIAEAVQLASRAADLGRNDAVALSGAGYARARVAGELDAGMTLLDRALVLNPNLALASYCTGYVKIFRGELEEALGRLKRVERLSPLDPLLFLIWTGSAFAHLLAGRFDEASSLARQALQDKPNFHPALRVCAAANALAGRLSEARAAMGHLRVLNPTLRVSEISRLIPLRRTQDLARYEEGLRTAGLPA